MNRPRLSRLVPLVFLTLLALLLTPLSPAHAAREGIIRDRPSIPGERTLQLEHFIIHYAIGGFHGVNAADSNGDGTPDYVSLMAETLEYVWRVEIDQMGFVAPIFDSGEGGDWRLDVYIQNVMDEGYAGYVDTGDGYVGDNPNTPEKERNTSYGFMVLDNDYAEIAGDDSGETPSELLQVTVAHEFNHLVQAAYDDYDPHTWLYEATSTWMEDAVFDDVNDGVWYLDALTESPDTCLVTEGGIHSSDDDNHWYATWLFLRSITEQYGGDVIRTIWENNRNLSGFDAIDAAVSPFGTSLVLESQKFVVNNLLRNYEEGAEYPVIALQGTTGPGEYIPPDGVMSLASDTISLSADGPISVSLGRNRVPMTLQVVGVRAGQADVFVAGGGGVVVDTSAYDNLYAIVHNDSKVIYDEDCVFDSYSLNIAAATTAPAAPARTLPAGNFVAPGGSAAGNTGAGGYVPPTGAPVRSEEEQGNFASTPSNLPVSFTVLEPAYLPEDYAFDYSYIMTAADFGDSSVFYTPSGEDVANMDYLDDQGSWLSIAESPSPYATIGEWLADIGYDSPGEIIQLDGVEVLMEDLSDEESTWFSATVILDDLFIVVDGDSRQAEVEILVQGLIATARGESAGYAASGDISFNPVEPGVLPAGYSFDTSYVMTAEDFGDNAAFYSPSGENTLNFDYLGAAGGWLSIAESPSPYATLDQWLSDIGYDSPGTIRNISGIDVLVEDLSQPGDPWFSATFIDYGIFFVVDGDSSEADVIALVTALIDNPVAGQGSGGTNGLSFEPIEPVTLPAGYSLDDSYTLTADDFGDNADFYTPSGELTYNLDYLNNAGDWLSIAESPSPYGTLSQWMSDVGYDSPGAIRVVSGREVLVEDLSNEEGPWYSATLILDDLFIVVDGDSNEADVIALAQGLINAVDTQPSYQSQTGLDPAGSASGTAQGGDDPLGGLLDGSAIWFIAGACGCTLVGMIVAIAVVLLLIRRRRMRGL